MGYLSPYEGLVETDICIGGITAQHSGVIIVRRAPTVVGGREVPGLVGTNVWRYFPEFQSIVNTQRDLRMLPADKLSWYQPTVVVRLPYLDRL